MRSVPHPLRGAVAITRQMKQLDLNPKMYAATAGSALPKFYDCWTDRGIRLWTSQWEAGLVTLRAGGLIPIARQYPGAGEFVEAHRGSTPGPISRFTRRLATGAVRC